MKRVLVTGASGRIGSAFVAATDRFEFRLIDMEAPATNHAHHETMACDIADLDQCRAACDGIDNVLHLAADPKPHATWESLERNNIRGTHNIYRAAADAGCRRVIFASSIHAVIGYPLDEPIDPSWPVNPTNLYGVSKVFGEATGRAYTEIGGLSTIAVRIGAYHSQWLEQDHPPEQLAAYVSPRDLNQLFVRCIDAEDIDFAIVVGQSNNRIKRMSLDSTIALLGYQPVDDGFDVFPNG